MSRYNCNWVVSFLPTRTEVMITDRETGSTILEDLSAEIDKNFTAVEDYLNSMDIKVFNYNVYEHRIALNFVGKGKINVKK